MSAVDEQAKPSSRSRVGIVVLGVWAIVCLTLGASLMVGHWVPLPVPDTADHTLRDALNSRLGAGQGAWLTVHFLDGDCACSNRIVRHLERRGRIEGTNERVVVIGGPSPTVNSLRAAGFQVDRCPRKELANRFHVEAAPLLVISDSTGALRYVGGYTDRRQGPRIADRELLAACRAGDSPTALPLYGCGATTRLRDVLDPLGIKYSN